MLFRSVINGHIRDGISAVGGDGEGLTAAIGYGHPAAGSDGAAFAGGGGDGKALRGVFCSIAYHRTANVRSNIPGRVICVGQFDL